MQQRWSFCADHQNSHRLFDVRRTIFDVKAIAGNQISFLVFSARRRPKSNFDGLRIRPFSVQFRLQITNQIFMKTNPAWLTARATIGTLFLITSIVLVVLALSTTRSRSATPGSGTIASPTGSPLAWDGTATGTGSAGGEGTCVETVNCDTFTLSVGGTQADWVTAGKRIEVKITPPFSQDDYDLVIHKTSNAGT